ncbi:unnamed protein product [Protopolystoma xenopodis]|uniref:HIT-type domain-containing protein n=1 Tax=Protopolystoma xenopodis TaxID=117903 RepID=A0A3S5FFW0_9PLAT|nr:unnamed protein product [Protopolystoma xenopodis]
MTAAKYSHPNRLSPQSIASSSMNFQYTAPLTFLDSLFAVKTSKELDSVSPSSIPVELRLCEICKTGSLRRYACPITKRSLCSLACYRENQKLTIQEAAIDGLDVVS